MLLVGGRGDRQQRADRLDPDPVPVGVDVGDHLLGRRSSSAAKKAEALFRTSLARRSSRFSRSRAFRRSRSSLVRPGRRPSSTSARRTQLRSVSCEMPNLAAIEVIAAHCEGCSSWCSNTMRTARSRTSWGYLLRRVMAPTSHELEPPRNPERFTEPRYLLSSFGVRVFLREGHDRP